MSVTRGQAFFLGVFLLALIGASAALVQRQIAPRPRAQSSAPAAGAAREAVPASVGQTARLPAAAAAQAAATDGRGDLSVFLSDSPAEYGVIAERNLFKPLLTPPREQAARPVRPVAPEPVPIREPVIFEVLPAEQSDLEGEDEPGPAAFNPEPASPSAAAPGPELPIGQLAATGFVQKDGEWTVLLENLQSKQSRYAYPGETHWGYRVGEIDPERRQVVLAFGGEQHQLRIGQNKQREEIKPPTGQQGQPQQRGGAQQAPQQGGPPPGMQFGFGGGPPADVMERIRQRFGGQIPPQVEQRIRGRMGGGGGGRSGGRGGRGR